MIRSFHKWVIRISNRGRAEKVQILVAFAVITGCAAQPTAMDAALVAPAQTVQAALDSPIAKAEVDAAIREATLRLVAMLQPSGRFVYRVDMAKRWFPKASYNVIRHAGAIYALGMAERQVPGQELRDAILSATRYFVAHFTNRITFKNNIYTVVVNAAGDDDENRDDELKSRTKSARESQTALGGAGLGIVAMLTAERLAPGTTSPSTIEEMARFILYLQKADGTFISKYDLARMTPIFTFDSLYYPGEAILALTMMYEWDHNSKWLIAAERGMAALIRARTTVQETPPDNWALIATERLLVLEHHLTLVNRLELVRHVNLIVQSDLKGQILAPPTHPALGCFDGEGRTAPTAVRMEGIQAVSPYLKDSLHLSYDEVRNQTILGVRCLLRSQVKSGEFKGAIPQNIVPTAKHAAVVRIDYIQHALSAMIRYRELNF